MATPPPIVSSRYCCEVGDPACLKSTLLSAVMSVNVTGDWPLGPAGGGALGNSSEPYARPGRGVGVGCCAVALTAQTSSKTIERSGQTYLGSVSIILPTIDLALRLINQVVISFARNLFPKCRADNCFRLAP